MIDKWILEDINNHLSQRKRVVLLDPNGLVDFLLPIVDQKRVKILKEDLHSHTLMLMETGKLELISDLSLLRSLKSITFEYTGDRRLKIFGDYSHLTEALVRACWCLREKSLNLYCF